MAALVLTVIGDDRHGIVERVSQLVRDHQGNWESSRMARLGGQFAGIALVTCGEESVQPLTEALAALSSEGISVRVQDAGAQPDSGPQRGYKVEVVGADRPGIVSQVAAALHRIGANVDELDTRCESAAMSGENLFRATLWISCARERTVAEVRSGVQTVGDDLMIDVSER